MRRIRSCKAGRSSLEPRQRDQDHVGRWRRGPKLLTGSKNAMRPVGKRRLKAVAVAHSEPPGVARTRTGGRTEKQAEQQCQPSQAKGEVTTGCRV